MTTFPFTTTPINGFNLAYRELGQGDRHVVFVHGWASSGRMWEATMRAFAPDYHCWAIDLVGFGDSERPENGWYSIQNWSRLVTAFSIQMNITRPVIVGHSMGGTIALTLAAMRPDAVERIGVINPVVTGRLYLDLRLIARSPFSGLMLRLGRWFWPIAVSPVFSNPFGVRSRRASNFIRNQEDWSKVSGTTALGALRAVLNHDLTDCLPRIEAPTLVVLGTKDLTAPNREGRLVVERVPNARLVELPAGHLPTDDAPEETHRVLREFLACESVA